MTGDAYGLCPSCFEGKTPTHEWPEGVPRPENIPDGAVVCDDCYASLVHYTQLAETTATPLSDPSEGMGLIGTLWNKL